MTFLRAAVALGLAAAIVLGVAGCARRGAGPQAGGAGKTQAVTVKAAGMKFDPTVIATTPGTKLTITFNNTDTVEHNLTIPQLNAKMPNVPAGKSQTLDVTVTRAGEFDVICTVPGHRESGMLGKLSVKG